MKKIKYFLITLTLILITKNCFALDYTDYGTNVFNEELESKLEEELIFDNYLYSWNTATPGNNAQLYICIFRNTTQYRSNGINIEYDRDNNNWNILKCYRTTINNLNTENSTNWISAVNGSGQAFNYVNQIHSSIELTNDGNENGTITVNKDINYTKPTCPECEECSEKGECGPVEITNFPIDKTEFYVLLLMLGTLIFMLFFKWCFPMKGGKK